MSRPKERIPTQGPQSGLNTGAFAGLSAEGLSPGRLESGLPEPAGEQLQAKPGRVVLRRETARRGGKEVVVVDGFGPQHSEGAIEALGRRLRAVCGCGGTVRDRVVEVQGNQLGRVREFLEAEGFRVAGER
jgi:translation initiation factor 1